MIIAFVVVGLLGGGAWYYLSGQLAAAQQQVSDAKSDFDKYSTKSDIVVGESNANVLQANIDLIRSKLNPLIETKLQPKTNKLQFIDKKDPIAWKHEWEAEVQRLTGQAKVHSITLPQAFGFGFSRYLSTNPGDEQTIVLSKQLLAIDNIVTILINAPVRAIQAVRRTYEEDPRNNGGNNTPGNPANEADHLQGSSVDAPNGTYTAYPFEVEFDATPEGLRKVVDGLVQSPYIFIIRTLSIQNTKPNSPRIDDLDKLAGSPSPSLISSSPGAVAAATSTKGPQYLFGNAPLHIKLRIDLIQWKTGKLETSATPAPDKPQNGTPAPAPSGN